jgi:uncharacterized cupin superfamily protein
MIPPVSSRPNVHADEFSRSRPEWRAESVVRNAGGEKLGGTLFELSPGSAGMPMHLHYAMEELIVVISGRPTLRTLEGESELAPGDVVACPVGKRGCHQVVNRTDEPIRYLIISTMDMPEILEYPELGTVRVLTEQPSGPPKMSDDFDGLMLTFDRADAKSPGFGTAPQKRPS